MKSDMNCVLQRKEVGLSYLFWSKSALSLSGNCTCYFGKLNCCDARGILRTLTVRYLFDFCFDMAAFILQNFGGLDSLLSPA